MKRKLPFSKKIQGLKLVFPINLNIIVTSPPYGDFKTTVAYGQFSRLSLQWLGFRGENLETDLKSLGGKNTVGLEYYKFHSPVLMEILWKLAERDKKKSKGNFKLLFGFKRKF